MQRIATSTKSVDLYGAGKHGFTDGNPGTGIPATQLEAAWVNAIQEEIARVVEGAGGTLNPASLTQLWDALEGRYLRLAYARTKLTVATTFYVATTGSDTTGTGAVGAPWLTIQKAIDTLYSSYDLGNNAVTISVADGTYTAGVSANGAFVGGGSVTITGNVTTPANCLINLSSGLAFGASYGASLNIGGFKVANSGGYGLGASTFGAIEIVGKMDFGACSAGHMLANGGGFIGIAANYTISGASPIHYYASNSSTILVNSGVTVTVTGTPAFSGAFASGILNASIVAGGVTFSGSATGVRYSAQGSSSISTSGGGANFFPGNSAGTTATGGQYL